MKHLVSNFRSRKCLLLHWVDVVSGFHLVTHPLHAVAVPDLQLLLGPLEAAVLLVVGRGLEVDVDVIGGLRSRGNGCKWRGRRVVSGEDCKLTSRKTDRHGDTGRQDDPDKHR